MNFPPPEIPYEPEDYREVEIQGLMVFQVTTFEDESRIALAAVLQLDGEDYLYRFTLPRHTRAVRQIFRRGGMRTIPHHRESFNITGVVALDVEGTIIGEDQIREDLETLPAGAYVLQNVVSWASK